MRNTSALQVLCDRASEALEGAALKLASLQQARQHALQQQQLLCDYQYDYQQLLGHEKQRGLEAYRHENYQRFLKTIGGALSLQNASLTELDQQQRLLLAEWQQKKQQLNALEILLRKRSEKIQHRARRTQQKENDEFALRQFTGAKQ